MNRKYYSRFIITI